MEEMPIKLVSSNKRREEFKSKIKAMRIRMNKKREKFLNALKNMEYASANKPAIANNSKASLFRTEILEEADYIDIDAAEDTLRSLEVSFVDELVAINNQETSLSELNSIRSSIVSRTSTPIYVNRRSLFTESECSPCSRLSLPRKQIITTPKTKTPKCCSSRSLNKNRQICTRSKCNQIDYQQHFAAAAASSSYLTSFAGRFQNYGEFKVWFV